jgi:hypothetical protein
MVHQQLTTSCETEIHCKATRKGVMQLHAGIQVAASIQMGHQMSFGPLVSEWLQQQQPREFFVVSIC